MYRLRSALAVSTTAVRSSVVGKYSSSSVLLRSNNHHLAASNQTRFSSSIFLLACCAFLPSSRLISSAFASNSSLPSSRLMSSAASSIASSASAPNTISAARAAFEASIRQTPAHTPITPVSSPEDQRSYRIVTLGNGLTCILVHDPLTDKAGAGMDVHVGHFSDPAELPGLAHFLEHMLFLGTEKFPDENSYSSYLSSHGGSSNAYTSTENTNYYFDVSHSHLLGALDRFSAFFTCPLFTPSCVERELNAVHNENSKNLQVDQWRMFQLLKSTSSPSHPFSKFGTGNHATLRDGPKEAQIDVRGELLKFHKNHYSSHIMKLTIVGRETLDELEKIVREKFSDIPRSEVDRPVFSNHAMSEKELQRLIHVIPVKDQRTLQLLWHFPTSVEEYYTQKPFELLSHCLGHESHGSIFSYLKKLGYANGLSAGTRTSTTSFALFAVTVDLTPLGIDHTSEIVEIIYSYLHHVLRESMKSTPERWEKEIFTEVQAVNSMGFRFKSKESPINLVSSLSSSLQHYPPKNVLNGPYELVEYNRELLSNFLDILCDTKNLRIHIIGQKLKPLLEGQGKTLEKEKWYGTEYLNEVLPETILASIRSPRKYAELSLPTPNDFIATDFSLAHTKMSDADIAAKKDYAPIALDTLEKNGHPLSTVWFKADKTFSLPKANILLRFVIPLAYQSPQNALLANLYAQLLTDALNEFAYMSQIAGLSYSFYATQSGLQLSVGGYSQKQSILLDAILKQMKSLSAVEKSQDFDRLKEQLKRQLENFVKENPYSHCLVDELLTLEEHMWSYKEKLGVIDSLTPQLLDSFLAQFLTQGEMDILIHGNLKEEDAKQIATQVQSVLQMKSLYESQLAQNRIVKLSPSESYLRQQVGLNSDDANSASLNLYQLGENTVELHGAAELFAHLVREPLYNQLRTQEQLGYLVWSSLVSVKGILHFRVLIQSSSASADYLNYRIEAFLQWYRNVELPRQLSEDPQFFATNIAAVCAKKLEKDKTLTAESTRFWHEITTKREEFDRVEREVDFLKTLDVAALYNFMNRYITMRPAEGESQRAKYNIQYFGNKATIPEFNGKETEERLAFANLPLPVEKPSVATDETAAPSSTSASVETVVGTTVPQPEAKALPTVPVDHRSIRRITDMHAFKRTMPLYPSMQ